MSKERVTVTVDSELVEAASQAIADGHASSLSGWVNLALSERVAKERRLRALAAAVATYEREFGEITPAELAAQDLADRRHGITVKPRPRRRKA